MYLMLDFNLAGSQRADQLGGSDGHDDPTEDFLARMSEYGLDPGQLDISGKLTRFDIDKRGDKAGWYVYYNGDISAGAFGDWRSDLKETWCSQRLDSLSWDQRARYTERMRLAKEERERQEQENQARAKETANRIWQESRTITSQSEHQYLINKQVQPHYCRITADGSLVVPQLDDRGEIWSLQFIKADGDKKFLPFGRRDGLFFEVPGGDKVFLCEGFSTGASINEATGATVIVAFNAGSLPKVARILRNYLPGRQILIAADNDQFKPEVGNAGITKANEAAAILGNAPVLFPTFRNLDSKPTDFNDLMLLEGAAAVVSQLGQMSQRAAFPPLGELSTKLRGRVIARPKPKEFIWTCNGMGYLPKGVVGVLAATGGTGKTFFLCALGAMSAGGFSFGPIQAVEAQKTLIICGEDDQDEVERRLWDVTGGDFPDKLHAVSVYGSVGPLMELDGNKPVRASGFYWLEETIQRHPGLELLILDPKSRFYGLDENNNDHATQWVQSLEYLSKLYDLTILFSAHTSEQNAAKISQKMNRGASALVDGCRWQAGLVRMDKDTADKYGIEKPRNYVVLDTPKNNYAADVGRPLYFKRTDTGTLTYCNLNDESMAAQCDLVFDLIERDPNRWSRYDLKKNKDFINDIKERFTKFTREDLYPIIDKLIEQKKLFEVEDNVVDGAGAKRKVLVREIVSSEEGNN